MPKFTIGRKRRQNVKREPNGKPQRDSIISPNAIAQLMPHRRLVPANVAHDPKAETIIGRLCLNGHITEEEYQAALKYRDLIARYKAVISSPKDSETSMSGVIVGPWGAGQGLCQCSNWHENCENIGGGRCAKERLDKYNAAFEAVEERAGHRGCLTIAHALTDRPGFAVGLLVLVLCALCRHFGLTNSRKYEIVRNRR